MNNSILASVVLATLASTARSQAQPGDFAETFVEAPLAFVANHGQWRDDIRFKLGQGPVCAAIHAAGFSLALAVPPEEARAVSRGVALGIRFEGSGSAGPFGVERRRGVHNYLLGDEPDQWHTGVPSYGRLRFDGVWPGIDVVLREGEGLFEYDLVLAPGARLDAAVLSVEGAQRLSIDAAGRLAIETEVGTLLQTAPVAWTTTPSGVESDHPCRFRLLGDGRFGFEAPEVPADRVLIVDPGVRWSTFLGDGDFDSVRGMVRAPGGDLITTGTTISPGFPRSHGAYDIDWNGAYDAFVFRLSSDGRGMIFSTFLGGAGSESGHGVAIASDGSVYVGGETNSSDFPTTAGANDTSHAGLYDAFVSHLNSTGTVLLHSTFLGGVFDERLSDLVLDGQGRPVVCGSTASSAFPVVAGSYDTSFSGGSGDAFLSRLSSDLANLQFSSFLGGTGNEHANCLAIGEDDRITVGGWTRSTSFPTTAGVIDTMLTGGLNKQDGFLTRFESNAQALAWSTYLGGFELDEVEDLVLDSMESVYAVGGTESADFPVSANAAQSTSAGLEDAFLTQLSPTATQVLLSTYFGGSDADRAGGVALLPNGSVALCGTTASTDLALEPWVWDDVFGQSGQGLTDVFINRYAANGVLNYSTYLGGGGDEMGLGIVSDGLDGVVVCGETNSFTFPITPGAFDISYDYSTIQDGFVTHFAFERFPFSYGTPKINSIGGWAAMSSSGFPELSGNGFQIWVDGTLSNTQGLFFYSTTAATIPFAGGELLMGPPFQRTPILNMGWLGSGGLSVVIEPAMVGTTYYYQFWYADPGDPYGVGLSAGLEVLYYP